MAAVLVIGPTVTQNSPVSSLVLIVPTHGGMARLSRPGWLWLNTKMIYPRTVTHPSTNRARRRATTLIETNALPLSQAGTQYLQVLQLDCCRH